MTTFKRCLAILFVFALAAWAQTLVVTTAEITCDSAAHALGTATNALWVQLNAPTTNSAVVRWGDSSTSATRGGIIAAGGAQFLPFVSSRIQGYDLTKVYYYCTTADKLEIVFAR